MQLELYCEEHGIEAEIIEVEETTKTAKDAARVLDTTIDHIIKSLVFFIDGEPFLVVVRGPDRVDEQQLAEVMAAETCRLAEPDEVEELTGYHVGEVPPVSIDLPKIIDETVLQYDEVYGGGGATNRMIALDPRFIIGEDDVVEDVVV